MLEEELPSIRPKCMQMCVLFSDVGRETTKYITKMYADMCILFGDVRRETTKYTANMYADMCALFGDVTRKTSKSIQP
jgi:hypothetical protein